MNIGPLTSEHVDEALALSSAEGWNQSAEDWRRMVGLEPSGCFLAREEGRLVGTVTTTTYGRDLAWVGMMVVHPDFRRRGIGAALMRRALDHLHGIGIASIKLDATPAGRPLYESLGFTAEAEVERRQGIAPAVRRGEVVHEVDALTKRALGIDRLAYGADRSRLLERLVADGATRPLVGPPNASETSGFALARRGRDAAYIGPLVAAATETAVLLLDGMLERLAGVEVCLDLHRGSKLEASVLEDRKLTKRRGLLRMAHGRPYNTSQSNFICLSAGPEFG